MAKEYDFNNLSKFLYMLLDGVKSVNLDSSTAAQNDKVKLLSDIFA